MPLPMSKKPVSARRQRYAVAGAGGIQQFGLAGEHGTGWQGEHQTELLGGAAACGPGRLVRQVYAIAERSTYPTDTVSAAASGGMGS